MFNIGIDWSRSHYDIALLKGEVTLFQRKFDKNRLGLADLMSELKKFGATAKKSVVGIETDKDLIVSFLIDFGYSIYSLNPKAVERFKDRFSVSGKKDDSFDAYNIALILAKDKERFAPIKPSSSLATELYHLVELRRTLVKDRTRYTSRLRATLSLYFPAFLSFFTDLTTSVPMNVLKQFPVPEAITSLSFLSFFRQVQVPYFYKKRRLEFYKVIREESIDMPSNTARPFIATVAAYADQLLYLREKITKLEKQIKALYESHQLSQFLDSIPGVGYILGAQLIAYLGDNKDRFASYRSVQCYAGTAPITKQSGQFKSVKMRLACNKRLANTFFQIAFCSLKYETWTKEYYDLKRKTITHSAAVRSLANKWSKIIYVIWKNEIVYNKKIFLKNRPPAA